MEFLIIEDGEEKIKELQAILKANNHKFCLVGSEKEAKKSIRDKKYDMILLDMELPCSDTNIPTVNKFSGITIMNSMKCYNINIPVLLITQYTNFSDMTTMIGEKSQRLFENQESDVKKKSSNLNLYTIKFLKQLHMFMSERYSNYIGAIHYSNVSNKWKNDLMYFIDKIGGNYNESTSSRKYF